MKLSRIFDALTSGELSQVHIGGGEEQGITVENHKDILTHINLGLTDLHKRFLLRESRTVIPLEAGVHSYTVMPGTDELLKIERIFDDKGCELGLNDETNPDSIMSESFNTIWVPEGLDTLSLKVVYRANHPEITKTRSRFDPDEIEVGLPVSHLEPLLMFVASRVLTPAGMNSEFHDGNNYAARYEQACRLLENQNFRIDKTHKTTKFERNGWA